MLRVSVRSVGLEGGGLGGRSKKALLNFEWLEKMPQ